MSTKHYYTKKNDIPGKIADNHPNEFVVYRQLDSGSDSVLFGQAVVDGATPGTTCKEITAAADSMRGIAVHKEGVITAGEYAADEGVDVLESGIINVVVEEAVTPADTVRVRHAGAAIAATSSIQDVDMGITAGTDASGLANDATEYAEQIKIGDTLEAFTVTGSDAQTITLLLASLNGQTDLGTFSIVGGGGTGDVRLTADTAGVGHEIRIQSGGDLFSSLTGFVAILDPVDGIDGTDAVDTVGSFRKTAAAGETAVVVGAEFRGATTGPGVVPLYIPTVKSLTADT